MPIVPGQVYRSVAPVGSEPQIRYRRIKVVGQPNSIPGGWNFGKVDVVTLSETGREMRRRRVETTQLHDGPLTKTGQPRRAGYILERAS